MAFDGNGNYTVPSGTFAVSGEVIGSAEYNAFLLDLQTALSKALLADGQRAATQNISMGGNRLTGLADGISATDAVTKQQLDSVSGDLWTGLKNALINSNFAVNQDAVSGTVTLAAGAYGHDMWKAGSGGCTYTFANSGGVTTLTISAGSLIQVIEGALLQSEDYTLSWTGTVQGKIGAGSYGTTGQTVAVTGGVDLNIEFGTGTLAKPQFERGGSTSKYEHRPPQLELLLAQRYYFSFADEITLHDYIWSSAGTWKIADVFFPVEMRAAPTVTRTTTGAGTVSNTITTKGVRFSTTTAPTNQWPRVANLKASARL